ncbi:MAG: ATP-dependent helicase [Rhodocyclales bacterium CG_4_9_14_3_um_filter_68_10]|nr:MAG: ATP-dependent helicase [Rhodocyclales bacterium CG_4_9_14_3_um_filter_68_10]
MIVLHAGTIAHRFFLWGESDAAVPGGAARARKELPAPHPFAAQGAALLGALAEIVPDLRPERASAGVCTVWIPATRSAPLASTALIAPAPEPDEALALAPWSVPAVQLAGAVLVDLLAATLERQSVAPGIACGRDLGFWSSALRFASALVTRQQMLPALERRDGIWRARWRAVVAGPDAERLDRLAQAMPDACRALSEQADHAPVMPAAEVLTAFIDGIVDHLARLEPWGAPAPRPRFESLHDQWLYALGAADGVMEGEEAELAALAAQIEEWQRPIGLTAGAPVKLCFRLEEPAEADAAPRRAAPRPGRRPGSRSRAAPQSWRVRFLLQAANDPSLLIDASEAWRGRSRRLSALGCDGFKLREYLLAALGQAAGLCPRIEASLKRSAPGGYALDTLGAHEFLTEKAGALEQAGFGVMLPAWWTPKGTRLRLSARAAVKSPRMQAAGGMTLEKLLRFDWEIALGEHKLTLAELQRLARLKVPLVRIRGEWVQLSAEEIEAAIALWRKRASGKVRLRELIQMALSAPRAAEGINFDGVRADGWIAQLLSRLEGRASFDELAPPAGFKGSLRPYQVRGYSWLAFLRGWGLGACLADDMGLGKTIQMLSLIEREWESGNRAPVLLVSPTSVTGNWQKEAQRFTPRLPVLVHHGTERSRGPAFAKAAAQHALVVTSYALLVRDIELFRPVAWAAVVLDEAQNIKNPETKQAKAARALAGASRIALTGTPVENNVGELWSIMEFLNPGFLGTQADFKRRFFLPIQLDRDPAAIDALKRLTGPFILRRLKSDKRVIADLPDKLEMKVFCPLTREQASLYAAVVKEAEETIAHADGIQRKGVVLATLTKLKQVCNHPAHFLGDHSPLANRSGKLARLAEMLEEVVAEGDRALVFTQFAEMGTLLQRHLQEIFAREVPFLHGGVAKAARDRMVERFQSDDDAPSIFLLSLKAGGTGLNLTHANHVFHFDRWWNPAVENQATDRAFRIGQTRNVQVHKFLCQGTLEERIDEMIERKKDIAADVVGAGEGWLTELSNAQLRSLFALRADAIQE